MPDVASHTFVKRLSAWLRVRCNHKSLAVVVWYCSQVCQCCYLRCVCDHPCTQTRPLLSCVTNTQGTLCGGTCNIWQSNSLGPIVLVSRRVSPASTASQLHNIMEHP